MNTNTSSVALCVLGMRRSGTSAIAGLLHYLGVDLGKDLMPPGPDNPKGFWEYGHAVAIHIGMLEVFSTYDIDFLPLAGNWLNHPDIPWYQEYLANALRRDFSGKRLWAFKDPRICRLLPVWPAVFSAIGADPRFILALRHPDEVAGSLLARSGIGYNEALLLWLGHTLEAELHTRGRRRMVVAYEQVLSDWRGQAARIATGLGVNWPNSAASAAKEINAFLDPALRHNRAAPMTTPDLAVAVHGADRRLAVWAFDLHRSLGGGSANPAVKETDVDRIRHEVDQALPSLMHWRLPRPAGQRFATEYKGAERMVDRTTKSA